MSALARSRLNGVALAVGVLSVVMLLGTFFVRPMEAQAWVYTAAFGVGLLAVALAAGENLHLRHERLSLKPTSRLGWWSVVVAVVAVILFMVATSGVFASNRPDGLPVPMFLVIVPTLGGAVVAGVLALVAWFRSAERSLLVLLTLLPALFAVYFVVGEFAFPH